MLTIVALCTSGVVLCAAVGEEPQQADEGPLSAAPVRWTVSKPLVGPVNNGGDLCYSIKDPSISTEISV